MILGFYRLRSRLEHGGAPRSLKAGQRARGGAVQANEPHQKARSLAGPRSGLSSSPAQVTVRAIFLAHGGEERSRVSAIRMSRKGPHVSGGDTELSDHLPGPALNFVWLKQNMGGAQLPRLSPVL